MLRFCAGMLLITVPSKSISPSSILLNPAIIRRSVVFPHPDGPRSVKNSPFLIFADRSGMIVKSPYFFTTLLIPIETLIISPSTYKRSHTAKTDSMAFPIAYL